jgi:exodeoxyribonuclease VII large subunit
VEQSDHVFTITEITRQIKLSLEAGFSHVTVMGEISNLNRHSSGHMYFTLKDEGAALSAVLWRSRVGSLGFSPEDGVKVVVRGDITVYPPRGNYQIDVQAMQPLGIGELQLEFERLKKQLLAEGLFDEERKKPIPQYPSRIGIITSPTGAALQDIITIISRRFPAVELLIAPVRVQGTGAAKEIAEAIAMMNESRGADVLIVGRGGGSLEDLWPFNEEIVARAIDASQIPIISAVGHEVDFSISDFVADLRAPTPSAAAELVVPDRRTILETLRNYRYTINDTMGSIIDRLRERVAQIVGSYAFNRPVDVLRQYSQHHDELEHRLHSSFLHGYRLTQHRAQALRQRVEALNPDLVLKRGYALVRKEDMIVKSRSELRHDDMLTIQFHDGKIRTRVE